MLNIRDNSDINLWFGGDLFCQVNLWFVLNLLKENLSECKLFLIIPKKYYCKGFSLWNESDFLSAIENRF